MALFEGKTPAERNKLIAAIVLGAIALISLSYMLFGSSSSPSPKKTTANSNNRTATTTTQLTPPPPEPQPSPSPPPPITLASISPPTVFARTGEFTLELSGEKFTIGSHVFIDDVEMPTRYIGPQRLSTTVPAQLIGNPGGRQIVVRTPDGTLFSNPLTLTVQAPPTPNFSYVGIIGSKRYNDTAVLKDNSTKQLLNVQRGDVGANRFRVTSISEREVALVDTNLRIKHTLPFTSDKSAGMGGNPAMGSNP